MALAPTTEEIANLRDAAAGAPEDARAANALAEALYAAGQQQEAVTWWEKAARLDRTFAAPWRRLGIAYYNLYQDRPASKGAYHRAFTLSRDPQILFERDQLWKRLQVSPAERLEELEQHVDLAVQQDEVMTEVCALFNQLGDFSRVAALLGPRQYDAGAATAARAYEQYLRAQIGLARLAHWRHENAGALFAACLVPPSNFAGAGMEPYLSAELHYWQGIVLRSPEQFKQAMVAGDAGGAEAFGIGSFYAGLAMRELDFPEDARKHFGAMEAFSAKLRATPATAETYVGPPVLATPFKTDWVRLQEEFAGLLEALALYGLHDRKQARIRLNDLLRDNPNHWLAADFLRWLDWGA